MTMIGGLRATFVISDQEIDACRIQGMFMRSMIEAVIDHKITTAREDLLKQIDERVTHTTESLR